MHLNGRTITAESIRDIARTGDVFASNGAFLRLSVDDVPMGSVCPTAKGKRHRIRVTAYPAPGDHCSLIQLIGKHGAVLASRKDFEGGELEYELDGADEPGYMLARAFGPGDDPNGAPERVRHLAVTNPVYLYPSGFRSGPAETSCVLHVPSGSRWTGGSIEFQDTDGRPIASQRVVPGTMRIQLPANARILLRKPGQDDWMFYIAMENAQVENLISYLVSGDFRKDYPNLRPGQVPPAAFRLPEMRKAISTFDYSLE